jgi:hypothetical protein
MPENSFVFASRRRDRVKDSGAEERRREITAQESGAHSKRAQKVQKILLVFLGKPIEPHDHFVGFRRQLRAFPAAVLLNRHHEVLGSAVVQEK